MGMDLSNRNADVRFPSRPATGPLVIAHRGARAFAPENTLDAFDAALACGADGVEFDVHLSRDQVPVVIHDDDLLRTTDAATKFPDRRPWWVSSFTAAELGSLNAGVGFAGVPGVTPAEAARFPWDRTRRPGVPTLAQVLDHLSPTPLLINIELKTIPRLYKGLARMAVAQVRSRGLQARTLISSFDHRQLEIVRQFDERIATGVLDGHRLARPAEYCRMLEADVYLPGCIGEFDQLGFGSVDGKLRTEGLLDALEEGLAVLVWTENDPARLRALAEAGVTGLITDFPNRAVECRSVLR